MGDAYLIIGVQSRVLPVVLPQTHLLLMDLT